jgi:hypothetical protein
VTDAPRRSWGYRTQAKLALLRDYLPAFLHASKGKASEFVYLDAFAGEGHGTDRLTGDEFPGSARIALDIDVAGGFTKLRYFEQASKAVFELKNTRGGTIYHMIFATDTTPPATHHGRPLQLGREDHPRDAPKSPRSRGRRSVKGSVPDRHGRQRRARQRPCHARRRAERARTHGGFYVCQEQVPRVLVRRRERSGSG